MGTRGISAIVGAILVSMAFEPTTIMVKLAYALFGAAAGSIVGKTIEAEAVNVKKQFEEMKSYREYAAFKNANMQADSAS
jgi:dolichol kinase